jgi:hypothetical protein
VLTAFCKYGKVENLGLLVFKGSFSEENRLEKDLLS